MARIRTVKPEFWEDELLGVLPRDARLLFIATFNLADDEGILRWTPAYIKASVFMYDDDLGISQIGKLMHVLADAGLVFPFISGVAKQQLALVVNFRKHQRINRPQASKLPAPPLQNPFVREMYARRDGWTCRLCGGPIPQRPGRNALHNLAIDRVRRRGTDHPSNVAAVHQVCGQSRFEGDDEEFVPPAALADLSDSLNESVNGAVNAPASMSVAESREHPSKTPESYTQGDILSLNSSLNDSLTNSPPEGKGREQGREGNLPARARANSNLPAQVADDDKALADRMTDEWRAAYGNRNVQPRWHIRRTISDALTNGVDPDELRDALKRLGDTSAPVTPGALQFAYSQLRKERGDNVLHLDPSTADQRAAQGQAWSAFFREQERRELQTQHHDDPQETA